MSSESQIPAPTRYTWAISSAVRIVAVGELALPCPQGNQTYDHTHVICWRAVWPGAELATEALIRILAQTAAVATANLG